MSKVMRNFETGATRNVDATKPDYEGFLSPYAVEAFGEYMNKNRLQSDGQMRASDNWQLGIPDASYMKSLWRHFMTVWKWHRGIPSDTESLKEALAAVMFNAQGYLHEVVKREKAGVAYKQNTPQGSTDGTQG